MFYDSRQGFLSKIRGQGEAHAYVSLSELRGRSPQVVPGVDPVDVGEAPQRPLMEVVMVAVMTKKEDGKPRHP